jgi:hypothetical protein
VVIIFRLGSLVASSFVLMNNDSFSIVMNVYYSFCKISTLRHCVLLSSFHECSIVLDLDISLTFVLRLYSAVLELRGPT